MIKLLKKIIVSKRNRGVKNEKNNHFFDFNSHCEVKTHILYSTLAGFARLPIQTIWTLLILLLITFIHV